VGGGDQDEDIHGHTIDVGNSILLELEDAYGFHYVFVGDEVMEFTTHNNSNIIGFTSRMHNDTLCPYAIDSRGCHYLFTEKIVVVANITENPYDWYYRNLCMRNLPYPFQHIQSWHVGDIQFIPRYTLDPIEYYNYIVNGDGYIRVRIADTLHTMDRDEYVRINNAYGDYINVRPINIYQPMG
jgi:hypothetical protein